jgi:DNA polymerase-3 subunit epsilon
MLPAELVPILDREHHITGFIILIEDQMTRHQREKELDLRLQEWRHKLIQSIAVISSTAEILADTPPDNVEDLKSMNQILLSEAKSAAGLLKQAEWLADLTSAQPWPLTPIKAEEWGRLLQERANEIPGMKLDLQTYEPLNMISIDPHHLTLTVVYLLKRLKDELEFKKFTAELSGKGHWIYLDCQWQGARLDYYTFESWKLDAPKSDNIMLSNSIDEILEFHGAKLWIGQRKGSAETHGMLLLLPVQENKKAFQEESRMTVISDSRPEFYDFNLFQQAGQSADMDKRLLAELSYTVFDTETTGLNPRGGDEIISIGAVRIVNSRLLQEEAFDQLVNPRRQVPWSSVKYHGINPELLEGKPYIEDVLPRFYDFARDTILIGHNVAFDMLMLQQKESISKVRFDQPILDTLLLSDVIHPAHKEHSIEAVAERLGVLVKERHTALGDANTTAEIFLKLLPLLAARGIHTLGQARQACEKTYYARLKY